MARRTLPTYESNEMCAGIAIGRTPLIKLSPKKTWEGFCGGLLMTLGGAWFLADWMSHYKWLVCPRTVCFSQAVTDFLGPYLRV